MDKMRIVVAVCPEVPVPPTGYGGTERRLDVVTRMLQSRGHDVTLLCGPGSTCPVRRVFASSSNPEAEWEFVAWLRGHGKEYDAVVDSTRAHLPSQNAGLPAGSPTVAMMTGDPLRRYPHDSVRNRVYCSRPFAEFCGCPKHPVLSNIFCEDPATMPVGDGSGGFVLYVGTVRPEKGVHVATRACRLLGVPLVVAGPVQTRFRPYFGSFEGGVDYRGTLGDEKWGLYRGAAALVFPISWCDAGPLVVKESLLAGTPVVACPRGGLLEDVRDGENGVLAERDGFLAALGVTLGRSWDRAAVRASILPRLDAGAYVDRLEGLLRDAAGGETW